jgi:hypothetical protein
VGWSIVVALVLIGAVINPPSNYDGLTYRLPRLLYWLQEAKWHWIDGIDFRLNITGAGIEWASGPILLFTQSDRLLFLLNFTPFLFLPGLFFIAATGLSISARSARWWMWIWPMAFGIAVQAASIGNDMICAALALASIAFLAQAKKGSPILWLTFSALSVAAMTGIKATVIPLVLPIGILWAYSCYKLLGLRRATLLTCATTPLAALSSFLPMVVLCWRYTGRWNGNPGNCYGFEPENAVAALVGNLIHFGFSLFEPPLFPGVGRFNQWIVNLIGSSDWFEWVHRGYACFVAPSFRELPTEEGSGIGLGISIAAVFWMLGSMKKRVDRSPRLAPELPFFVAGLGVAFLAFMVKSGVGGTPRLMVPFTPLLLLAFLYGVSRASNPSGRAARVCSVLPAAFLIPTLLLNANRPVIPGELLAKLPGLPPSLQDRIATVYSSYGERSQILAPLAAIIPSGAKVGFAGSGNHSAVALFKPYFSRRVVNLSPRSESGVDWVVGTPEGLEQRMGASLTEWESSGAFVKVREMSLTSLVATGPETWLVYRRKPLGP